MRRRGLLCNYQECAMNEVFVWGFNHHLLGIHERSSVSIDGQTQARLYAQAKAHQIPSICILNTCNRTEIYGIGDIDQVQRIFFELHSGTEWLKSKVKRLTGYSALEHLLKVASGLDSQIIGESEILGQFKAAFKSAKKHKMLNGYMERLANICMQAAKEIKTNTGLSTGTISYSYATINLLLESNIKKEAKILLIGTGELGKNIAKNLRSNFPQNPLYLSNRTMQKCQLLANELHCHSLDFDLIQVEAGNFDVIITSVGNVKSNLITHSDFTDVGSKLIIDLSIPSVIAAEVAMRKNVAFYSLDHVSGRINQTLAQRKQHIPVAEQIIHRHIHEFMAWSHLNQRSGSIKEWKAMMEATSRQCPHLAIMDEAQREAFLKKSISRFALFIKSNTHLMQHDDEKEIIKNYLSGLGDDHHTDGCIEDCPSKLTACPVCPR